MDSVYFVESAEEDLPWIQQYNQFNEELNIYRTVIVTNNKETQQEIYSRLKKDDFSVCKTCVTYESFLYKRKRILVLTLHDLLSSSEDFVKTMMGEHNFMILENLSPMNTHTVIDLLRGAKRTGFMTVPYYIWVN